MTVLQRIADLLPLKVRNQLEAYGDAIDVLTEVKDPRVARSLGPSGVRGLLLQRGKQGVPTKMAARHEAHFDWTYPADNQEMADLYQRAKAGQWNGDMLPWHIDVDPLDPNVPIVPEDFVDLDKLRGYGVKLDAVEKQRVFHSLGAWMLSQFLHGEQGALFAAAQVTEAVQFFDGKLYGATQVMDEGRHVEVFHRYLDTKLDKLYQVNDNLFVIMQIMVEGLALGAFGVLHKRTKEPLLKELLKNVIQDEARHVHYGVVALREHFTKAITESERREREDWAFEVSLLMRNRFMAFEVYEEWFEGRLTRDQWKDLVSTSPGMKDFRRMMFSRIVPNLREIGLLSPRILPHYADAGLSQYMNGKAADALTAADLLAEA
ncbi:MAG: ferritin-like domain-containing protein [Myxococcales bacterium]|nr:ferritin-like domain-containing protein [Myxococcales bacterium]